MSELAWRYRDRTFEEGEVMNLGELGGLREFVLKWRKAKYDPWDDAGVAYKICADDLEHWLKSVRERKLTVQQLNTALMHARWNGPFDPQVAVDELNQILLTSPTICTCGHADILHDPDGSFIPCTVKGCRCTNYRRSGR